MTRIEERALQALEIGLEELMERAGKAVAQAAGVLLKETPTKRVVLLAGKGNNGGDALVAARLLKGQGFSVSVFTFWPQEELTREAGLALAKAERAGIKPAQLNKRENLPDLEKELEASDLAIDGIFGFGFRGKVTGLVAEAIERLNSSQKPVLSIDVPSGVEADTGAVHGPAVRALTTLSFTLPKIGLLVFPGAELAGRLQVADIGIPVDLLGEDSAKTETVDPEKLAGWLPRHRMDVHKKERGRVLVIAGSLGMTGAAALTSLACLRSGAGTVTLGIPQSLNPILEEKLTEIMTIVLPETFSRSIDVEAYGQISDLMDSFDALVVGPGLSLDESTVSLVRLLVSGIAKPMVLDADGLNAMVGETRLFRQRKAPLLITPHPGELARLYKVAPSDVQADRLGFARRAAEEWRAEVVLKGAGSIVAGPEGETVVNTTGNPGMASAGTGDVLTGMIGGFLAQGLSLHQAAVLGVYLHGLAGDLAAEDLTELCLLAGDLVAYLPQAIKRLRKA
jgi:NAD(P)H-hydrate epimerase